MLLRSIYWYFTFVVTLICYIPKMYKAKRMMENMKARDFDWYIHRLVSRWAMGCVKRSGARFHFEGSENIPKDEAVVFVANHQGDFDIAVFLAYLPVPHGYVAKIEILKVPMIRTWMKYMRCIFIDRKNIRQTAKTLLEGVKILQEGQSLVLFPEGTRSKSEKMNDFKPAAFKLATRAKVPIVPVTINGSFRIFEANKRLIKPTDVYVKFHPLIRTDDNIEELPAKVRSIIEESLK